VHDFYDLDRFVQAQDTAMAAVEAELREGRKSSHWMWFVFPQIKGFGSSPMALLYAITSMAEAKAFLAHPVLGPRLRTCISLVLTHEDTPANVIFGSPDDAKFRSCLTLFEAAGGGEAFSRALETFFQGKRDHLTIERLPGG
jgi:uncharacterized protein (DUF1810 family)